MKHMITAGTLMAGLLVSLAGCGDDQITIVQEDQDYLIVGHVLLRPYVDFTGSIYAIHGQELDIDSIRFGDSLCTIAKARAYVEGNQYKSDFAYVNHDDTRFQSGESVRIEVYRGDETAIADLDLIEIAEDSVVMLSPADGSQFEVGSEISLYWQHVPNADWYSVYYWFDTSDAAGADIQYVYDHAVDTSLTLPSSIHSTDGVYRLFVGSCTGPVPGSPGNLQGETITGAVYGWAIPGVRYGWEIVVGDRPSE